MYRDRAVLSEVILYQRKRLLREQSGISLYGDRIVVEECAYSEIPMQESIDKMTVQITLIAVAYLQMFLLGSLRLGIASIRLSVLQDYWSIIPIMGVTGW